MAKKHNLGISVVEVILAVALFMTFATGAIVLVLQGYGSNALGSEETVASQFATEGIEAVRSIKNQNFANLATCGVNCTTGTGITKTAGVWVFSGTNNILTSGKTYTRVIKVENVQRDASPPNGNIVTTGGTLDPDSKKVTSTVTWSASPSRSNTITLTSYLSDWRKPIAAKKSGMLVYGNGGTTSDTIAYKTFSATTNDWSSQQTFDPDTGNQNRALRTVRIFSSATRNERVAIARHYDGSTQYVYAHVYNGASWTSTLLSSWNSGSFLDVRNFDGTYLADGRFMAVYSDNTTTPKYRTWDGTSWSGQANTTNVGGIPVYIVAKARPGTNEVIMAVFDQAEDTNTSYFNGTSWSAATQHATAAPTNTKEHIDFAWSPQNPQIGALVFPNAGNDTTQTLRIFNAGSGNWSAPANAPSVGGRLGAVDIDGRRGAEEFISCQKNANERIGCFRAFATASWDTPANNVLTNATDTGNQRSYNLAFEDASGTRAVVIYSDTTSTPKLKTYDAAANAFDATATPLPALSNSLKTIRAKPMSDNDDIVFLMGDANRRLYTIMWDGTADVIYNDSTGRSFTTHGTNGSSGNEFWFDFAWDKF